MKKIYIHIFNIVALIALLLFTAFAYLGMNFTPLSEPLTAEYLFLASLFLIWGVFYYLQVKFFSLKSFLILIAMEVLLFVVWGYSWGAFGNTLLENLIE